jgi:monoamine oxidase
MPTRSVIVIGAGAAGLAAARDLSRAGCEVVVIEARDRIGGRVFTLTGRTVAAPIELGAEFVHGKPPELGKIAQAANLKLS